MLFVTSSTGRRSRRLRGSTTVTVYIHRIPSRSSESSGSERLATFPPNIFARPRAMLRQPDVRHRLRAADQSLPLRSFASMPDADLRLRFRAPRAICAAGIERIERSFPRATLAVLRRPVELFAEYVYARNRFDLSTSHRTPASRADTRDSGRPVRSIRRPARIIRPNSPRPTGSSGRSKCIYRARGELGPRQRRDDHHSATLRRWALQGRHRRLDLRHRLATYSVNTAAEVAYTTGYLFRRHASYRRWRSGQINPFGDHEFRRPARTCVDRPHQVVGHVRSARVDMLTNSTSSSRARLATLARRPAGARVRWRMALGRNSPTTASPALADRGFIRLATPLEVGQQQAQPRRRVPCFV